MIRREEDGEDEHHNGMDDDYDYDDKDEDDNDDDDDNFGDNDKGWGPQMKCQTHDADTVGIRCPKQAPLPLPEAHGWYLHSLTPPTTSARINYNKSCPAILLKQR